MSALGFALGVGYVLAGMLALMVFADRYGTRVGRRLERWVLAQLAALALWPITLLIDALLVWVRPCNRRRAV